MKRFALLATLVLAPTSVHALDQVDANGPIDCASNTEVFYPRGDSWAFLSGGDCKGDEPSGTDAKLDAQTSGADALPDTPGHCMWVNIDSQGPQCKTGCPADPSVHAEHAAKTVFSSMRKWAGYKMNDATFGSPNWYCPSTTQDETTKLARKTSIDYTFGAGNAAEPTLSFFRGAGIAPTETIGSATSPNHGDSQECYTECVTSLGDCSGLEPLSPQQNPPLYKCPDMLSDFSKARFRFTSVRHHAVWVSGAGNWVAKLNYSSGTLAVTETIFWPDNGVTITSDMLLNNETIDWRVSDPQTPGSPQVGCDKNLANCFDLETVTTHESGHFIGMGHVNCEGAVMFKSALPSTAVYDLTKHEMAGVCSVYRPVVGGSRYPTGARENEGCYADADCNGSTGLKCLFSAHSLYKDAAALATQTDQAKKIPHRGICVKAQQCTGDGDCDPAHGRVCQSFDDTGTQRYCLPGSPKRPMQSAANANDFCAPCNDGTECSAGLCASTADMGLSSGNPLPARICTVKCNLASGCVGDALCKNTTAGPVCVPTNPDKCIAAASASQQPLNSACDDQTPCAAGLTCFDLASDKVCLEKCSATNPCDTPGYGCVFPATGPSGQVSTDGACFKKDMQEGDNCALPSSALCGLNCTSNAGAESCTPTAARSCFYDPTAGKAYARCYSLCSAAVKCVGATQTCKALTVTDPSTMDTTNITDASGNALGYCSPILGSRCLGRTGEVCATDADCDSALCQDFAGIKTCSNYCDASNPALCPQGTTCVPTTGTNGSVKSACKPIDKPLASTCAAGKVGCSCGNTALDASQVLLLLMGCAWLAYRARRI